MTPGYCKVCKKSTPSEFVSLDYRGNSHKKFIENGVVKVYEYLDVDLPNVRFTYWLSREFANKYYVKPGKEEMPHELPAWTDEFKLVCSVCFSRRNSLLGLPSTLDPDYEI